MTDWKRIADRLAARLVHHVGLCPANHRPGTYNYLPRKGCPFCEDDKAYDAYVKAKRGR